VRLKRIFNGTLQRATKDNIFSGTFQNAAKGALQSAAKKSILVALCIMPLKILFLVTLYKALLKILIFQVVALCKVP
jgi:hypothetical protein